jgi:uncharacterized protein (TIGR02145 family)
MEYKNKISQTLKSKLENAFESFILDTKNPLIIVLLKYPKVGEQIYLIAKDPSENTYYGIIEGQFSPDKQIFAIPESNITCIEFKEEIITPFRAKPYIESGCFEYIENYSKIEVFSAKEIKLGSQVWMRENLNVEKFQNGDLIFEAKSKEEWINASERKQAAWCNYENDSNNGLIYGKLYNWHAVNDDRKLAPKGWKIPSFSEWLTLIRHLGGEAIAGSKILYKRNLILSSGISQSGFDGMLGGRRLATGHFIGEGDFTDWWSSTEDGENSALSTGIRFQFEHMGEGHTHKGFGYYVRLLKT